MLLKPCGDTFHISCLKNVDYAAICPYCKKVTEVNTGSTAKTNINCRICFKPIEDEESKYTLTCCNNNFHKSCLKSSFPMEAESRRVCPICCHLTKNVEYNELMISEKCTICKKSIDSKLLQLSCKHWCHESCLTEHAEKSKPYAHCKTCNSLISTYELSLLGSKRKESQSVSIIII